MRISEQYYSIKNNILFCVAVPLFVMLFMVIYQPLFYGEADMLQQKWHEHESLCLPVVCAIALGVLAASRTLLCLTLVRHNLSRREWLLWQATEWVVGSLFVDRSCRCSSAWAISPFCPTYCSPPLPLW